MAKISRVGQIVKASGVKQEELARLFGVNQSTISAWCTGRAMPSIESGVALAKRLGVSLSELYGLEDLDVNLTANNESVLDRAITGELHSMTDEQKRATLSYIRFLKYNLTMPTATVDEPNSTDD